MAARYTATSEASVPRSNTMRFHTDNSPVAEHHQEEEGDARVPCRQPRPLPSRRLLSQKATAFMQRARERCAGQDGTVAEGIRPLNGETGRRRGEVQRLAEAAVGFEDDHRARREKVLARRRGRL